MQFLVDTLRYLRIKSVFVEGYKPYAHQRDTLERVRQALDARETICLINASVTGSGKTLANFAAAILDGGNARTIGVYPTNELVVDQYDSLRKHFGARALAVTDSEGLDDVLAEQGHIRTHAHALAWLTGDVLPTAVLTNPDVLYLLLYSLYGQMYSMFSLGHGAHAFRNVLSNYPIIAFDEFHLYNTKQVANAVFIVGLVQALAPQHPHVFIFSSATPRGDLRQYLDRLGLPPEDITAPSDSTGNVVCEPVTIDLLAGDLLRWKGGDAVRGALSEILAWADGTSPPVRGVFIVDSVYEAKLLADQLRDLYGADAVGEVHGYMDREARGGALQRRFTVGTTTIDVGVDLTGDKGKEFLVCEARGAAQALQRLGRLGRQGREPNTIAIPNRVWLVVPEYVYEYVKDHQADRALVSRADLVQLLNAAYLGHEEFPRYAQVYAPLEAVAACERVLRQELPDRKERIEPKLHWLVSLLYDPRPPQTQPEAEVQYLKIRKRQQAIWRALGQAIQGSQSKFYLSDLESFRGGPEGQFVVAIYDELDARQGLFPARTYNLAFVLRRALWDPFDSAEQFETLVRRHWPERAAIELPKIARQRPLGYLRVRGLIRGPANEQYFTLSKMALEEKKDPFEQVIRLTDLQIGPAGSDLRMINKELKKRQLNCWVSQWSSALLSRSLHLPPLFALYPLRAQNLGGNNYDEWSIAFGLDAFLLASRDRTARRRHNRCSVGGAIIV